MSSFPGRYIAGILILLILPLYSHIIFLKGRSERDSALGMLNQKITDISGALALERNQRIMSSVRRDSSKTLPENCLVLLTVPRSGSTWLLDSIRCHPKISFEPSSIIYDYLGLPGGRYPRGLSNGPDAAKEIEVFPNRGAQIPDFCVESLSAEDYQLLTGPVYAIEKIHPEFFDYNVKSFLNKSNELMEKSNFSIKFIYQVRDPEAVLTSFLNYKARDPKWYPDIAEKDAIPYLEKTYQGVLKMAQRKPGLIVDYRDLIAGYENVLTNF
jgi:hypothetical protein